VTSSKEYQVTKTPYIAVDLTFSINKQKLHKLENNFSAISWREQVNFQCNDDEVHFVNCTRPTRLAGFL